jgi:Dolichyl-phosphate-mannose-protein mannosyltransferase
MIFLASLPLTNPWVRGDGVGYYAFARAPLIEHSLDFQHDYQFANAGFRDAHLDETGVPKPLFRTATGHLDNHFTVGPAILWAPFLLGAHSGVLIARAMGAQVPADGFSTPYRVAMAFGTALYGFLGLLLSARLAGKYVSGRLAFLATVCIWWATSLPVYMYFNPSWSHAHSAFAVALFLWYWHKTWRRRSTSQWCILGLIAGLMLNVYYANATVLIVLAIEGAREYATAFRLGSKNNPMHGHTKGFGSSDDSSSDAESPTVGQLLGRHMLFDVVLIFSMLPTFFTRYVVYGSPFESGYTPLRDWAWGSPYFAAVLISSNHGLLVWTPVVLLAIAGLVLFACREPRVGMLILAAVMAFYVLIASYPDWAGISSYGNRFFVSLTAPFVLGLAVLFERAAKLLRCARTALATVSLFCAGLVLWNIAFIFQWGTHLVPARGPIVWSEMIHNQFFVVPREMAAKAQDYLLHRSNLMREIEQRDIEQMNKPAP